LPSLLPFRVQTWSVFSEPDSSRLAFWVSTSLIVAIFVSTVLLCVETMPRFQDDFKSQRVMAYIEMLCIIIFSIDYGTKVFSAPNRRLFVLEFVNLVDLVSVLPWYLDVAICGFLKTCSGSDGLKSTRVRADLFSLLPCCIDVS
jgi:hypothetical protein